MPLWTPAEITTELWLDADDSGTITESGGSVSQWDDKSGNGRDATQATPSLQPQTGTQTINGLNALELQADYINSIIQSGTFPSGFQYFVVHEKIGASNTFEAVASLFGTGTFFPLDSYNNRNYVLGGFIDGGVDYRTVTGAGIVSLGLDSTTFYKYYNGISQINTAHGRTYSDTGTEFSVGSRTDGVTLANAKIGEVILVSGVPGDEDRKRIEGYLAHKWGLTGNLPADHPYKNSPPTVLPPNAWTPANITTSLWLDADDSATVTESGGSISQWDDKSGNNRDVTQATGANQPTTGTRTIGGLNAIDFIPSNSLGNSVPFGNGTNSFYMISVISLDSYNAIYGSELAGQHNFGSAADFIFSVLTSGAVSYNRAGGALVLSTSAGAVPLSATMCSVIRDGNNYALHVDGTEEATAVDFNSIGNTVPFEIGSSNNNNAGSDLDGLYGELIIVNSSVSTADRQRVEGYLAWKWSLTGNLPSDHPYKNAAPTVGAVVSASISEAGDTLIASLLNSVELNSSVTESGDSLSADLGVPSYVDSDIPESGDILSSEVDVEISVNGSLVEQGDSIVANIGSSLLSSVNSAIGEQGDIVLSDISAPSLFDASINEDGDVLSASINASMEKNVASSISEDGDSVLADLSFDINLNANISEDGDGVRGIISDPNFSGGSTIISYENRFRKYRNLIVRMK